MVSSPLVPSVSVSLVSRQRSVDIEGILCQSSLSQTLKFFFSNEIFEDGTCHNFSGMPPLPKKGNCMAFFSPCRLRKHKHSGRCRGCAHVLTSIKMADGGETGPKRSQTWYLSHVRGSYHMLRRLIRSRCSPLDFLWQVLCKILMAFGRPLKNPHRPAVSALRHSRPYL